MMGCLRNIGDGLRVRPLTLADRDNYLAAFGRLSRDSKYMRFAAAKPALSKREIRYLLDVDHHDHEALVAYDPTGRVAAVGRYVALHGQPGSAEVAVTVMDDLQGRGLGAQLLELLACRAREEGIGRFIATALPSNARARGVLEKTGFADPRYEGGMLVMDRDLQGC